MNVQGVEVWTDIVRSIIHFFDGIVFFLLKPVLQGVFDLSSLTISSNLLNGVYTRIYVIVGIFMAFKLGFTFFKYIIDPDSMSDGKDKSLGKLLTNTIIMLAALIMLPTILFSSNGRESLVSRAERAFLPMLPRIVLGTDVNTTPESLGEAGDTMAATIMSAFFAPAENLSEYCNVSTTYPQIQNLDEVGKYLNLKCNAKNSSGGYSKYYVYTYNGIASTIVGGLLVVMFLGITINVAKRIFKLIILEMLAPIPIMTLIDSKSASSGTFSKWISSFVSVFLDIFIQYGIVYIGIYFIQLIVNKGLFNNMSQFSGFRGAYIVVALIIGVIYFAKEAPKFIQDALGLKSTGSIGSIFGNAAGMIGLTGGALMGSGSGIAGGIMRGIKTEGNLGKKIAAGFGSAITGGTSGFVRGVRNSYGSSSKGNFIKGIGAAYAAQKTRNKLKISDVENGSKLRHRMRDSLNSLVGLSTGAEADEKVIAGRKAVTDSAKAFKSSLAESAKKYKGKLNINGRNINFGEFAATLTAANNGDSDALRELNTTYGYRTLKDAQYALDSGILEKAWGKAYYAKGITGAYGDDGDWAAVENARAIAHDALEQNATVNPSTGVRYTDVDADNAGAIIGVISRLDTELKTTQRYKENAYNAKRNSKKG